MSYQRTAEDIKYITGIEVSKSLQQRLVHRQNFELKKVSSTVSELSVDGGNIRLRTIKENVPQVLAHRCSYLNGLISAG